MAGLAVVVDIAAVLAAQRHHRVKATQVAMEQATLPEPVVVAVVLVL